MLVGIVLIRRGFDQNSKESKLFASFCQFEEGISMGLWLGEEKQLKIDREFR